MHLLLLSQSSLKRKDEKNATRHIEACWTQRVKVQRGVIYIHRDVGSVWLIAPLKLFYVARNLHVFHLDVQSAGSLGHDGQSVCELQAVLSVLSRLLGLVVPLSGLCKREATLPFIVTSLAGSSWACRTSRGFLSCVLSLSIKRFRLVCLGCIYALFSSILPKVWLHF